MCVTKNPYSGIFVLVITCLGGQFGINSQCAFLKILKLPKSNDSNFKIFKNCKNDLLQKSPEINMSRQKSTRAQLQSSRPLRNNYKRAMSICDYTQN